MSDTIEKMLDEVFLWQNVDMGRTCWMTTPPGPRWFRVGTPRLCLLEQTRAAIVAEFERMSDKAIRFDLDQAGIESRERDAVELVELRARIAQRDARIAELKELLSEARDDVAAELDIYIVGWKQTRINYQREFLAKIDAALAAREGK